MDQLIVNPENEEKIRTSCLHFGELIADRMIEEARKGRVGWDDPTHPVWEERFWLTTSERLMAMSARVVGSRNMPAPFAGNEIDGAAFLMMRHRQSGVIVAEGYREAEALPPPEAVVDFTQALRQLINRHSMENGSNTADFILADYLTRSLDAFNEAVRSRDEFKDPTLRRRQR